MIIQLTPKEQENTKIEFCGKCQFPQEYIQERDVEWEANVKRYKELGKDVWNGRLYSFEGLKQWNMDNPTIKLGEISYSDRLFKKSKGIEYITSKYGDKYVHAHCGVQIIILTTGGKVIVGRTKIDLDGLRGRYAHISGNLNIDEMEIKTFGDIYKYAVKEIEEESSIKVDMNNLQFGYMSLFNAYCDFTFVYKSSLSSLDISQAQKDDEMSIFEALSIEDAMKVEGISDYEYSKSYFKYL